MRSPADCGLTEQWRNARSRPEIPSRTPEITSGTLEIPWRTPEIPSRTPEIFSMTPEIPWRTPEVPSRTPEVPLRTLERRLLDLGGDYCCSDSAIRIIVSSCNSVISFATLVDLLSGDLLGDLAVPVGVAALHDRLGKVSQVRGVVVLQCSSGDMYRQVR